MSERCDTVISSRGPCNTRLVMVVQPSGKLMATCPRCTARAQGRCWNCGRPRTNHLQNGVFCGPCGKAANRLSIRRAKQSPEARAKEAAWFQQRWQDEAFRQKRRERLREWKRKNPDKVKAAWARFVAKRAAQQQDGAAEGRAA